MLFQEINRYFGYIVMGFGCYVLSILVIVGFWMLARFHEYRNP